MATEQKTVAPPGVAVPNITCEVCGRSLAAPEPPAVDQRATFPLEVDARDHVAELIRNGLTACRSLEAAVTDFRQSLEPDMVAVPRAELDLLRETARQTVAMLASHEEYLGVIYGEAMPSKLMATIAATADVGKRVIDRGTDLGTPSPDEKKVEQEKAACIEGAIRLADALEKYEGAHGTLQWTSLDRRVAGGNSEMNVCLPLASIIRLVADYGRRLEDE